MVPLITKQVRWKWGELARRTTIFMPPAEPEDMAPFHLMNTMAKQERVRRPKIYNQVVYDRMRMTRLKLADSVDIGAGMHGISPTGEMPKRRYGMKQVLGKDGLPTGAHRERTRKALDYRAILPATPKANLMNSSDEETSSHWILEGRIPADRTQVRERLPN